MGLGAERAAAAAVLLGVRVVEDEPFAEQIGVVIERGAVEKEIALLVDEDLGAVGPLEHLVAKARLALPRKRVAEARAAAALDSHAEPSLADALLGHQRTDLLGGGLGDLDHRQWAAPTG